MDTTSAVGFLDVIPYIVSVATGVAGWLVGRRKERNDFLGELQSSIDMLAEKNRELYEEVLHLRQDNAQLNTKVSELTAQNEQLKKEIEELNTRLANVKTITRKA